MKKINILALLLTLSLFIAAQDVQRFFPKSDLILSGTYYYPEQWPENQWERDIEKMKELGFDFTHFGEFAWAMMEPEEGVFDFVAPTVYLDEALEKAYITLRS